MWCVHAVRDAHRPAAPVRRGREGVAEVRGGRGQVRLRLPNPSSECSRSGGRQKRIGARCVQHPREASPYVRRRSERMQLATEVAHIPPRAKDGAQPRRWLEGAQPAKEVLPTHARVIRHNKRRCNRQLRLGRLNVVPQRVHRRCGSKLGRRLARGRHHPKPFAGRLEGSQRGIGISTEHHAAARVDGGGQLGKWQVPSDRILHAWQQQDGPVAIKLAALNKLHIACAMVAIRSPRGLIGVPIGASASSIVPSARRPQTDAPSGASARR